MVVALYVSAPRRRRYSRSSGTQPGGVSRRTPAGSGGRRVRCRRQPNAPTARADERSPTSGVNMDAPAARADAPRRSRTSSRYMKWRSSSRPTASASGAPHQQTGAADPVRVTAPAVSLDRLASRCRSSGVVATHGRCCRSSFRAHHSAERQLRAGPDRPRGAGPTTATSGVTIESSNQPIDSARRHDRVAVEEQEVRAAAGPDADVGPAREPEVRRSPRSPARAAIASPRRRCRRPTRCRRRSPRGCAPAARRAAPAEHRSRCARALNDTMTMETSMAITSRLTARSRSSVSRAARGQLYLAQYIGRGRQQPRASRLVEQKLLRCRVRIACELSQARRRGRPRRSSRARLACRTGHDGAPGRRAPRAASGRGPRIRQETRRHARAPYRSASCASDT